MGIPDRQDVDKGCLLKGVHPESMKKELRRAKHLLEHQTKREEGNGFQHIIIVTNEVMLGHIVFNILQIIKEQIKRDLNPAGLSSKNGLRRFGASVMLHSLRLKLALGSHGISIVGVRDT